MRPLRAFGARPGGARAARIAVSPQFHDGVFHNPVPASAVAPVSRRRLLRELIVNRERRTPNGPVPLAAPGPFTNPADPAVSDELFLHWYGHASVLIEIEGRRVLVDPVWGERCSPSRLIGPRRLHPVPLPVDRLPRLDAVLISHDHYDHLDLPTVRALVAHQEAPFLVPLGVGAHLDRWRVPAARIVELDWQDSVTIADVRFTATAARHFSGRTLRRDQSLWSSWVITGRRRRVFYTGDSGYFPGYARIGTEHGPFDATLTQVGAYSPMWPDIHMTPEQAVQAQLDLRGGLLVPVHWGTFNLAFHPWGEPIDRLWAQAKVHEIGLAVPRPGERVSVDDPLAADGWWQALA